MAPFLCSVIAPAVTSTDHAASVTDRGSGHADTTNSGSTWAASQAYLRDHAVRLRDHVELVRYTRAADQRRLAEAAMAKTRKSSGKPGQKFANRARNVLKIKARKLPAQSGMICEFAVATLSIHPTRRDSSPS